MKLQYHFIWSIVILLIFSCQNNSQETDRFTHHKKGDQISFNKIVLYDDLELELINDSIPNRSVALYSPIYIGQIKDSIKMEYESIGNTFRTREWEKYKSPKNGDLEIMIDTTRTIGSPINFWNISETNLNIKAYPIFIKNTSSDTLSLGFGDFLPLTVEVKDSLNNWYRKERPFIYDCGTGQTVFFLPPKQIIVTTLRQKLTGTQKVIRLKYTLDEGSIYSNNIFEH